MKPRRNRGRTKNPPNVPRCGATRKIMFKSHEAAVLRAGEILDQPDANAKQFRAFRCVYCDGWHLTSKDLR